MHYTAAITHNNIIDVTAQDRRYISHLELFMCQLLAVYLIFQSGSHMNMNVIFALNSCEPLASYLALIK